MSNDRKKALAIIGVCAVILIGIATALSLPGNSPEPTTTPEPTPVTQATSSSAIIGYSVENREIIAHTYGTGETDLLFVGGIHGGYEWNSVVLAEEMMSAIENNTIAVPESITVHIIPNLNPDGVYSVLATTTGFSSSQALAIAPEITPTGRFNANDVDLNRNFGCNWQPTSTWRGQQVSAGTAPFSEPEAAALRDYVLQTTPVVAVFWHSMADNVYASECKDGVLPETLTLMETYARAADYGEVPVFDAYPITGDAEGWLASLDIPAITVEFGSRTDSEWQQNRAGLESVLTLYSQ